MKKQVVEEVVYPEGFPKSYYHKDFDPHGDEKNLLKNYKFVKSEEEEKRLSSDWGVHPSLKSEELKAEIVEEKPKAIKTKVKLD